MLYWQCFGWYGWKAIGEFSGEAGGNRQGVRTLWDRVRFWASLLLLVASDLKIVCLRLLFVIGVLLCFRLLIYVAFKICIIV